MGGSRHGQFVLGIERGIVIKGKLHSHKNIERGYAFPTVDLRYVTRYSAGMIWSIRHKGLKRLHEDDDSRGVITEHAEKLRDILARLDAAGTIADMDVPGFRLHPLKGEHKGFWAVTVRANWRVVFRFAGRDVLDLDYVDYH